MKYPPASLTPFLATLLCIRRKMHILSEPSEPKHDQPSARASIACALLNSLVALFSAPVLSFQWLAHSFAETPGVGVSRSDGWTLGGRRRRLPMPETVLRAARVGSPSATPPRSLRLCGIICRGSGRSFVFITLQIPLRTTSFFSHRYKMPGCGTLRSSWPPRVSPSPDSKAFPVSSVPSVSSVLNSFLHPSSILI
jgi:hypothetical protein